MRGDIEEKVGNRLRELRIKQGLSLRALAEKSGLSTNTLSLIETFKTSPSVSTLQQIAFALNCPIRMFFESDMNREPVIYTVHGKRHIKEFPNARVEECSCVTGDERILPLIVNFDPHSENDPQPFVGDGREFVYCLTSRVIYRIEGTEYILEPGDSLVFPGHLSHTWSNPSEVPCKVLIVTNRSAGPA